MTIKKLQEKENNLWTEIKQDCGSSMIDLISELIEVNLELERECNQ